MLKHGFWFFEFISISQQILKALKEYYRAFFHTETDDNLAKNAPSKPETR